MKQTLTPRTVAYLVGKTIVRVSEEAIHLDDGKAIYLDQEEIMHLNEYVDPFPEKDDETNDQTGK